MNTTQQIHETKLAHWTTLFHEQTASGLTIKSWCAENNVSIHAFYYWRKVAKERYVKSLIPEIVPLSPANPEVHQPESSSESSNLYNSRNLSSSINPVARISFRDADIEIGAAASDETIVSIVKAVRYA